MAPQRTINVGIVGLGFMAATHVKAYRQIPQARIHAVCNPSGRCLDGDLTKVGGNINANDPVRLNMTQIKGTRDFNELLSDPSIDLIDICTPTLQHPEMFAAALRAGKHVICEKPLARDSKLAAQMADAAKAAEGKRIFSMPAMCLRFWPEWAWLKQAIASNTYGRVLSARFRRMAEPPHWGQKHFAQGTASGGALLDLHIHDVDFIQYCFGKPARVFATGYSKYTGAIDHVVAQFEVASGAVVHAEGSWAMSPGYGFHMSYTVNFENATADYDLVRAPSDMLKLFQPGQPAEVVQCSGADGYVQELQHIFDSIEKGVPPSVVTMNDGLSAIQICEAEEKSIQSKAPVSVS